MQLILDNAGFLFRGLLNTFQLAALTLLLATVISVLVGLMAVARQRAWRLLALCYVEFFRDIPLIVNLLFVYFGAPLLGVPLSPFMAALVGLTLWGGANGAEIVRGGINAVPRHQTASATALGLKSWEIMWFIVGPQALLPILPSFAGLFTLLVQATSLASLVGVTEFLRVNQIVVERTTMQLGESPAFLVYGFTLIVYFLVCSVLTWGTRRLERRLGQFGRLSATKLADQSV